jgi:hypothetical protein
MKVIKRGKFIVGLLLMLTMGLSACVNPYEPSDPKVNVFELKNYVKHYIEVDRTHSGTFRVPVILDTLIASDNASNVYMIGIKGENLDDLLITSEFQFMKQGLVTHYSGSQLKYVLSVFDCEVKAKDNWSSTIAVRRVTEISFKLLNADVTIPVDIIIGHSKNHVFSNESNIIKDELHRTINDWWYWVDETLMSHTHWDIKGFGATDWQDPNYVTITNL